MRHAASLGPLAPVALDEQVLAAATRILDAFPFPVCVVDSAHTVLAANHSARGILADEDSDLLRCFCPNGASLDADPCPDCAVRRAATTGQGAEREYFHPESDLWVESLIYPLALHTDDGRGIFLHLLRDISNRKEMEHQLHALKDALERKVLDSTLELEKSLAEVEERRRVAESLRAQLETIAVSRERLARVGELAAGVAHAIRNPLHGLGNCVELLQTMVSRGNAVLEETLDLMTQGLARIETVTRRLLALARETPPQLSAVAPEHLVHEALTFASDRARRKGVKVSIDCAEAPEIRVDQDRLLEALVNLIDNAIDASEPGTEIAIRCCEDPESARVLLEVADQGEGMSTETLERVCDPFFTTKEVGQGTGLGLAICRRVALEHGGELHIESELGQGTRVRLALPHPGS